MTLDGPLTALSQARVQYFPLCFWWSTSEK